MQGVEIRLLTADDEEQELALWSQAFEKGGLDMDDWREMKTDFSGRDATFGLFDPAGLQAAVLVVDCKLQFGANVQVQMGALGGVACLPAARGKGYAGDAIRYALERMKEAGQVTSVLSPFSWSFYQKLGWDWAGMSRHYTVTSRTLRPDPETEFVRSATAEDKSRIQGMYAEFASRYRGMLVRSEGEWTRLLNDGKKKHAFAFVHERGGRVEGYLIYHGWEEKETAIREFIALTPRARRGLLGLLHRHEMQIKKFAWSGPENDGLWNQFMDWGLSTKLNPLQMARIVDVPGALTCLRPREDLTGSVNVAINDANAPWNERTWRIEFGQGSVEVSPTDKPAGIEMDIRQLTQAFFGTPGLADLREAETISVHSEPGYEALHLLLDGPPTWINDDF